MSSIGSFDSYASTIDRIQDSDSNLLSPQSSFSSHHASYDEADDDSKSNRNQPSARFHGVSREEDLQASSQLTLRDGHSLFQESQQSQIEALRDHITQLESRLKFNGYLHIQGSTEEEDATERTGMKLDPEWLTWHEYSQPMKRASSILEVLTELPHTRRKLSEAVAITFERPIPNPIKNIKRIRIRSHHIINALQLVTEHAFEDMSCQTLHQPFKILLLYQKEIEAYVSHLEHVHSNRTALDTGNECEVQNIISQSNAMPILSKATSHYDAEDVIVNSPQNEGPTSDATPGKRLHFTSFEEEEPAPLPPDRHHNLMSLRNTIASNAMDRTDANGTMGDPLPQEEALTHLKALVTFMKEDMGPIFERHRLLRSSKGETVSFDELWHLFMPGDLVVGNDEQNPRLYRVSIVPRSERYLKMELVKEVTLQSDGQVPQTESTHREAPIQCFNIDVFCFDYDGESYGPVESRISIVAFEGEKNIVDLPYYPVRFRKDAAVYKSKMAQRGAKFIRLCTEETAYREYSGLSAGDSREHIDSQVIVDGNLAYRMDPSKSPRFGLRSRMESNNRVVRETCDIPGCNACSDVFSSRLMFDDHRIDRRRTFDFIRVNRALLRTVNDTSELTEDLILLLPNYVYGFVLRSRRWHSLNIANIRPILKTTDGFESLILPEGVARLVKSLVQTHDPKQIDVAPEISDEQKHQVDLVRGKGKGLIILLHGEPGVGKTSTAECVAEHTQRPLFPITCGDIGETAREVENNLKQNFDLAHRWGCVLLLDEADVFLQARDKEDMRRNSVVSVFLRVLEYYSGILILTTNKVGHFDEAFTSRIHVSLYYPPLDKKSTLQIWKMNLSRLVANRSDTLVVDRNAIEKYAKRHYRLLHESNRATWNGRQIKNAFQTAIALAEYEFKMEKQESEVAVLKRQHFEVVAKASEGFDAYLSRIHGTSADRARRAGERDDDGFIPLGGGGRQQRPSPLFPPAPAHKKAAKKHESSSDSSSSDDEDVKETKRHKKGKSAKKNVESSESTSSEETDEKEKKKRKKDRKAKKKADDGAKAKEKAKAKVEESDVDESSSSD